MPFELQATYANNFQRAMECVEQKSNAITRRSAGLPSVLAGIVKADEPRSLLKLALEDLRKIAARDVSAHADGNLQLPQVHALNCAKDLFVDSQLGPYTQGHIALFLDLAADSLDSSL